MPKFNTQRIILAALALIAVFVWYNGLRSFSKKKDSAPSGYLEASSSRQEIKKKRRAGYKDWGVDPFVITRASAPHSFALALDGIVYDDKDSYALINNQLLHIGDEVNGKQVVDIQQDRVILNDGTKDIELRLEQ